MQERGPVDLSLVPNIRPSFEKYLLESWSIDEIVNLTFVGKKLEDTPPGGADEHHRFIAGELAFEQYLAGEVDDEPQVPHLFLFFMDSEPPAPLAQLVFSFQNALHSCRDTAKDGFKFTKMIRGVKCWRKPSSWTISVD
jgi:hypothetical protein